jgi:hypothetical protein
MPAATMTKAARKKPNAGTLAAGTNRRAPTAMVRRPETMVGL